MVLETTDKVTLLGSCCVGKTSVFDILKQDPIFEGWNIQESISRKLIREDKISVDRNFQSIKNQSLIFDEYVKILDMSKCLSDRSIIDVFTMTRTLDQNIDVKIELNRERRILAQNIDRIGKIFYFPIYWDSVDDGERLFDEERRKRWDLEIQNILYHSLVNYTIIPNCSVTDRVKFIKKILMKDCKLKKVLN